MRQYNTPPVKVEQLLHGYGREKIKTQGEKIKTQKGKNIIYFPPVEIGTQILSKKDCVQWEKYDWISLLQYFPPVHRL
jgi:hypothetical protein